jgi:competence protein ComEC
MLLRLCAALLAGVLLPLPAGLVVLPLLCASRPLSRRSLTWIPPVVLAFVTGAWQPRERPLQIDSETMTCIEGWITVRPHHDLRFGTWRAVLRVQQVSVDVDTDSSRSVDAGAHVIVRTRQALPPYGSRIRATGHLVAPRPRRNFHGWDERAMLRARDAWGTLLARNVAVLPGQAGNAVRRDLVEPLRARLLRITADVVADPARGLQQALLVGIREALAPELEAAWRALGMSHVLALSGMHVGVVAAGLLAVAGNLRTLRGVAVLLCGVFGYAALGGLGSSVLRASLMVASVSIATFLGRARRPLRSLGSAVLLLLAVSPQRIDDLGFQLSCTATLGILAVVTPLTRWALGQRGRSAWRRVCAWAVPIAGLGIAAQIATLPWILHHFGMVSWMSPVSNLLLVPPVDVGLILALAAALLSLLSPDLARPLWLVSAALLHTVAWLSMRVVQHLEPRVFLRNDAATVWLAACAAVTFVVGMLLSSRRRWGVVCIAFLFLAATFHHGRHADSPEWRLDMLDVGQGDATVLRVGDAVWLIDAGPLRPLDQGERVVLPHLRREGIDHLRGVVVSHPHADHYGGILAVLKAVRVDTLYVAAASLSHQVYASWRAAMPRLPVRGVQVGDHIQLGARTEARVLWPPRQDELASGANGVSVALWVRSPSAPTVLFMGDLEEDGERRLLQRWGDALRRHRGELLILKAGHHGSDTSSSAVFLDAIDAEVALLSVGERNRYGHPAAETLEALRQRACITLRTDRGGDIGLEQRGNVLWLVRPLARPTMLQAVAGGIDVVPAP